MIRHFTAATAVAFVLAVGGGALDPAAAQDAGSSSGRSDQRSERMMKRFDKMDRNNDGAVDRAEIERRMARAFSKADRNGDGAVDQEEIKSLGEKSSKGSKGGGKKGKGAKRFQKADADRDGRVTKDEFLAKLPVWFTRADNDRDGRVTKPEYETYLANPGKKRGKKKNRDDN